MPSISTGIFRRWCALTSRVRDGAALDIADRTEAAFLLQKVEQRPAPAKAAIASVEHHAKERRAEVYREEAVAIDVWFAVRDRTRLDHRGKTCCEACHKYRALEPHHLVLQERVDRVEWVMALCADCHRLDPKSAHRAPRAFAQTVVVPWLAAHGYPTPNRKEYRA